jgi:hypothetical protein
MAEGNKREKMGGSLVHRTVAKRKKKTNTQKEISIYKLNFPETLFFSNLFLWHLPRSIDYQSINLKGERDND